MRKEYYLHSRNIYFHMENNPKENANIGEFERIAAFFIGTLTQE